MFLFFSNFNVQEDDIPVPPAKTYNLDFLDNLDDPNFNPFQTKTAIQDNFGTSAPVEEKPIPALGTAAPVEGNPIPAPGTADPNAEPSKLEIKTVTKKKFVPRKPLTKKPVAKPVSEDLPSSNPVVENESEADLPSVKGYNLDFLGQLDDPSFNPFETKTSVGGSFEATTVVSVEPFSLPAATVTIKVESKPENFEQTEPEKSAASIEVSKKKKDVPKPWLKKKKLVSKPVSEQTTTEPTDEPIPPPSKGYNLNFLDNMDDPNFNPFVTKTNVVDDVNSNPPSFSSPPKPLKTPANKLKETLIKRESTMEFEMNEDEIKNGVQEPTQDDLDIDIKPEGNLYVNIKPEGNLDVDIKPQVNLGLDIKPEDNLEPGQPDLECRLGSEEEELSPTCPPLPSIVKEEKREDSEEEVITTLNQGL